MLNRFVKVLAMSCTLFIVLSACSGAAKKAASKVPPGMQPGEIKIKSVTHDAEHPLKKGDKVHIKVEVENFDPQLSPKMGMSEIFARIANQPGEILLRNDGTLGDTTADDTFFEGEYIVNDQSKRVVNGKIMVNTYREQVVSDKAITIQP
jgi:hypothetical protein